jgi:tetratricopeptide (TPR) repeat protein
MTMKLRNLPCIAVFFATAVFLFPQTEESNKIFEENKEGVLSLYVYGADKELITKGVGFGLSEDVIISSYHLVSNAGEVEGINVKGKKMRVEGIIAVDRALDIALLKVKGKVKPIALGNSDEVQEGARVFGLGTNEAGDIIVSEGTVRKAFRLADNLQAFDTSLSIPEGFNGGPLVNLGGQAVGIILILEKTAKIAVPANSWSGISRTGKITEFKNWAKEDYFTGPEGTYLGGRIFAALDDLGNASKFLERVVKANPSLVEAQSLLADVYAKQRNYSAAASVYQKVVELDPSRATAYAGLGNIHFRMQNWNGAVAALEKAYSLDGENKAALFTVGNAYDELRDFAKAADAYERFLKTNPEMAWTGYLRLGLARHELGQFDQAVAALESARKDQPRDVKVNESLVLSYQKAGQLEQAEAVLKGLAEITPGAATKYYSDIVKMYDEAGRNENAIEAARKVIELNPKSEIAIFNLGIMFQKLKRYEEAIAAFEQALQVKPDYDAAHYNIGLCYFSLKKNKEAIGAFRNYVAIVPDNADAWLNIGVGHMQMKEFEAALEPLKRCVELRPDYGAALYNLAITYLNLKDNYSARDVYKTLVTVDPDLAEKLKKYLR